MGIPYVPVVGLAGSSLLDNREDMILAPDPFEPGRVSLVARAYRPEVALLHGWRGDPQGNVVLGEVNDDQLLAEAARRVIVSVEEVAERLTPDDGPGFLPGLLVDAVVHAPFGAHPTACPGHYPADHGHLAGYVEAAASDERFRAYLDDTVFAPADHAAYVERFVPPAWQGGAAPSRSA